MSDIRAVQQAERRYKSAQEKTEAAREAMFQVWVAAVMSGLSPEDIAAYSDFSAAYIRRTVRERGVEPLPPGRKG